MGYSLIAHAIAGSSTGDNVTTGAVNTTSATLVLACIVDYFGATAATISDNQGNTYTALTAYDDGSGGGARIRFFRKDGPVVGASHTATASSTQAFPSIWFSAWSGSAATSFDTGTDKGAGSTSAVTSQAPGSATPSQANDLITTGIGINGAYSGLAVGSSFTLLDSIAYGAGTNFGLGVGYLIQGAAGAVNPSWSWTTAETAVANLAAWKAAASGFTAKNRRTFGPRVGCRTFQFGI